MGLHSEANLFAVGWCGMFSSFGVMIWNLTQDALLLAGTAEGHIGSSLEDSNFNHHGSCIQTQFTPHWWCWHLAPIVVHLCRCQKKKHRISWNPSSPDRPLPSESSVAHRRNNCQFLQRVGKCWEMLGKYWEHISRLWLWPVLTGSDLLFSMST